MSRDDIIKGFLGKKKDEELELSIGSLKRAFGGSKGEPGVKGDKGDKGEKGDQGVFGRDGKAGSEGKSGEHGAPGEKGDEGTPGEKGEKGETGEKGEPGIDGINGVDGKTIVKQVIGQGGYNAVLDPGSKQKGDVLVYNGNSWKRLPVGVNDEVVTADSTTSLGIKWAAGGGSTAQGSTFTYNGDGTINTITNDDTNVFTYSYNGDGTINTIIDDTTTWTFTYSSGKITEIAVT